MKIAQKIFLFSSFVFEYCLGRSCTDKTQASAMPKGLKEIPVVLTIAKLGSDVRLPCHYCDQTVGITGRIWRQRRLTGEEKEIELDMHDDDTKNRVFTDRDHNLIIRDVNEKDGAYYFCYDIENRTSSASMKMDILLDVGHRNMLEPNVLEKIPQISMYSCYAEWGPWSKCDVCGKVGKRKRIGECRLQKFVKAQVEAPQGKSMEADFPIVGIGCHSVLLNAIPAAKKILNLIPNIVLQEKCEVSCENYMATATEMAAYKRSSFLKKIKMKTLKSVKGGQQKIVSEEKKEHEGESLAFFCPGASLDTRVKWKFGNRPLRPEKIKDKTYGRVTIDATDTLHIKELRITDGGEYVCTLYDVEIGIVRLKVISKYAIFDPTSNFGILTMAMLFSFMIWIMLMFMKWKSFKLQYQVQLRRAKRKQISENIDEAETQSLLAEN